MTEDNLEILVYHEGEGIEASPVTIGADSNAQLVAVQSSRPRPQESIVWLPDVIAEVF